MQLSKTEFTAFNELKSKGFVVFGIRDLRLILNVDKTKAYNIIKALKKKRAIKKIKNVFTFIDEDEFVIGSALHYPSYISFWSALNYYGWSDQNPKIIYLATTKYSRNIEKFIYVTLRKNRYFGYKRIGEISIAEKEKAIVDSLLFPKYSGGMREIKGCLEKSISELDKKKLISYAIKIGSKAVIRRLGFLLEQIGVEEIDKLRKYIGKGYELLDPSLKRKNIYNKTWLLDINW